MGLVIRTDTKYALPSILVSFLLFGNENPVEFDRKEHCESCGQEQLMNGLDEFNDVWVLLIRKVSKSCLVQNYSYRCLDRT